MMQYTVEPLMISVSKGGDPVDDPNKVESQRFWGGSIFDDTDEDEEDKTFF